METWIKHKQKVFQTVTHTFSKGNTHPGLLELDISHFYKFRQVFKDALRKHTIWKKIKYSLKEFIHECKQQRCRRAEVLGGEYYQDNGGYVNNSHFLFGQASQFRINPG